jgi:hypothetical protein
MRLLTAVAVLALALPAAAQEVAFDPVRLSQHTRILSADDYQGRGIATPAEDRVIGYMSGAMAAAGLEPGGENGGWTQAVALNRFTASNIQARLSVGDWTLPLAQGESRRVVRAKAVSRCPTRRWCSSAMASMRPSGSGTTSRART